MAIQGFKKYLSGLVTFILALGIVVPNTYLSNIPLTKAATYTVTNTADSGAGSFRQAIIDANGNPGADIISFSATGTVTLSSSLETIMQTVTIDGTTAPDDLAGADITLAGSSSIDCLTFNQGGNSFVYGIGFSGCRKGIKVENDGVVDLQIGGTNVRQGNIINGSTTSGISLEAGANTKVYGNSFGILGGNAIAIQVSGGNNNWIGGDSALQGNEIVSSTSHGIDMISGTGMRIAGNVIGAKFDGSILGNGGNGINLQPGAAVNLLIIGGDIAANQILGNTGDGILIDSPGTNGVTIQNNYIGISATGFVAGNGQNGVTIRNSLNTIGGNTSSKRNYISGNIGDGIRIGGSVAGANNFISKNYIGTDPTGNNAKANGGNGIKIDEWVSGTQIQGNVIAGNTQAGIYTANTSTGTTIYGNSIGVGASLGALGNSASGVNALGTVKIGTADVDANKNIIGSNLGNGIVISGTGASNSIIEFNEIGTLPDQSPRGNGQSGILVDGGATDVSIGADVGPAQTIATSNYSGITIDGASTDRIAIFQNNLPGNGLAPITITNGANGGIVHNLTIATANTSEITGTASVSNPTIIYYMSGPGSNALFKNSNSVSPDQSFYVAGQGVTNDNYWLYIYDQTTKRSSAATGTGTLVADITAPSEPIMTSSTGTTANATYIPTGTKDAYSAVYASGNQVIAIDPSTGWTGNPITLTEGLNTFILDSRDLSNNVSTTGTYYVTLDRTAPVIPTLSYDPIYAGQTSIISGSGEVASLIYVNNVYTTTVAGDGTFNLSVSTILGSNIFDIKSVDSVANTSGTVRAIIAPSGGGGSSGADGGFNFTPSTSSDEQSDEGQSMAGESETSTEPTEPVPEDSSPDVEVNLPPVKETTSTAITTPEEIKPTYSNLYPPASAPVKSETKPEESTLESQSGIFIAKFTPIFTPILEATFMGEKGSDEIPLWWKDQNFSSPNLEIAAETDTDEDGLPDVQEFLFGTDPKSNDSDKDGVADTVEIENGSNPDSYDTDGDGIPDEKEKSTEVSVFNQKVVDKKVEAKYIEENEIVLADGITLGTLDSDSDGLSDQQELQIGSDPQNGDSDSDGLTDGNEVLLYDSNPAKASKVSPVSIANIKKGQMNAVGEQYIMGGTDTPNATLTLYVIDENGIEKEIGKTETDANGLYSLTTSQLEEGKYTITAVTSKDNKTLSVSYPEELNVSKNISVKTPEIAVKVDGENVIIEGLTENKDSSIIVTWRSLVLTNTIVADQNFKLTAPASLEPGDHTATVYSVSKIDNSQSAPVQVKFTLSTTGFASGQTQGISPLITIGGSSLVLLSLIALAIFKRKKTQ